MRRFLVLTAGLIFCTLIAVDRALAQSDTACYSLTNKTSATINARVLYPDQVAGPPAVESLQIVPGGTVQNFCFTNGWGELLFDRPATLQSASSSAQPVGGVFMMGDSVAALKPGAYNIVPLPNPPHESVFPDSWWSSGFLTGHAYTTMRLASVFYHEGDCNVKDPAIVVRDDGAALFHARINSTHPSLNGDVWHTVVFATMDDKSERGGPFDSPVMTTPNVDYDWNGTFGGQYTFRPGDYRHIKSADMRWEHC